MTTESDEVAILRELEWGDGRTCLICGGLDPQAFSASNPFVAARRGHAPDCRLAKVLAAPPALARQDGAPQASAEALREAALQCAYEAFLDTPIDLACGDDDENREKCIRSAVDAYCGTLARQPEAAPPEPAERYGAGDAMPSIEHLYPSSPEPAEITAAMVEAAGRAYDAARCSMHEKWHGGKCEPMSEQHLANIMPMFQAALEAALAARESTP